nr:hypothetical protein Iba_chr11eCG15360 [Ipomoea batatas]
MNERKSLRISGRKIWQKYAIGADDRRLLSRPPRPAVAGIPSAEESPCPALAAGLLRPSPRFEVSSVVSVAGVVGCSVHSGAVLCAIFFWFASPKARKTMTTISALLATKPVAADSPPATRGYRDGVWDDAQFANRRHPLLLGYWLLSNLDLHSMSLRLPNEVATPMDEDANDVATPMDEDAVEAVLGLPRGPKVITDRARHEKSVILNSLAGISAAAIRAPRTRQSPPPVRLRAPIAALPAPTSDSSCRRRPQSRSLVVVSDSHSHAGRRCSLIHFQSPNRPATAGFRVPISERRAPRTRQSPPPVRLRAPIAALPLRTPIQYDDVDEGNNGDEGDEGDDMNDAELNDGMSCA